VRERDAVPVGRIPRHHLIVCPRWKGPSSAVPFDPSRIVFVSLPSALVSSQVPTSVVRWSMLRLASFVSDRTRQTARLRDPDSKLANCSSHDLLQVKFKRAGAVPVSRINLYGLCCAIRAFSCLGRTRASAQLRRIVSILSSTVTTVRSISATGCPRFLSARTFGERPGGIASEWAARVVSSKDSE
jgi:hypothetical protein